MRFTAILDTTDQDDPESWENELDQYQLAVLTALRFVAPSEREVFIRGLLRAFPDVVASVQENPNW